MDWLAQSWLAAWMLFCLGAMAVVWFRYRETRAVRLLIRLSRWLAGLAIGIAAIGMLLMLIGSFTVEWTCHCDVPGHWECKGAECNAQAMTHFDTHRHKVSCARTDWPMRVLRSAIEPIVDR